MQTRDELPFLEAALQDIIEVADKPDNLQSVFAILNASHGSPLAFKAREKLLKNPDIAEMAKLRYWGEWPKLDRLLELPEGSLGQLPKPEGIESLNDAHQYIQLRSRAGHDLWHLVLNIPTTLAGEVAIVAVAARQLRYPSTVLVLAAELLSRCHLKDQEPDLAEAIAFGLQLGGVCAPLLAQRWEEGWNRPLSEWRHGLGITQALEASPFGRP
jgi:ubiquinone biosynthesis protein Coq4